MRINAPKTAFTATTAFRSRTRNVCCGLTLGLLLLVGGTPASHAATFVFQEGAEITVDGVGTGVFYAGTHDTFNQNSDGSPNGNATGMWMDDANSGIYNTLVRFDDIFGPGAHQIPVGSSIASATLEFVVFDGGTGLDYGEVHTDQPWDEATATWSTVLGNNGIQYGIDTTLVGFAFDLSGGNATSNENIPVGSNLTDVTSSIAAWSPDPSLNNGWGFTTDGANTGTMAFSSSEAGNVGNRPLLRIELPAPVPFAAPAGIAVLSLLLLAALTALLAARIPSD